MTSVSKHNQHRTPTLSATSRAGGEGRGGRRAEEAELLSAGGAGRPGCAGGDDFAGIVLRVCRHISPAMVGPRG